MDAPRRTIVTYLGPQGTFTEAALVHFIQDGACAYPTVTTPPPAEPQTTRTSGEASPAADPTESHPATHPTESRPATRPTDSNPSTHPVEAIPVASPGEALAKVASGEADFACVAIESSVEGAVTPTFDALALGAPLQIYREVEIPIAFSVLTQRGDIEAGGADASALTWSAHPVARPQVEQWMAAHFPGATFVPAASNGAAAEAAARGEVDIAIAPARAGKIHQLRELAAGVADVGTAHTRFVLVGRPGVPTPRTGHDRTSIVFRVPNRPGSLVSILAIVASHGVDVIRIESRPIRERKGEYRFFADMAGHIEDAHISAALHDVHHSTAAMRYLGSWPMFMEAAGGDSPGVTEWPESYAWVQDRLRGVPQPDAGDL